MQMSEQGRDMLRGLEGLSLRAYPDGENPDGSIKYSIGYGHSGAKKGDEITAEQAEALLDSDVRVRDLVLNNAITEPRTTQGQWDAMASLAYNVGLPAFEASTLLRRHNNGDFASAALEFPRWKHSAGLVDKRLVNRRKVESELYAQTSPRSDLIDAETVAAGGAGMALLFFCPYCSHPCAVRCSVGKVES